ncbi:hypothetical protein GW17_00014276 [Ensete ventricosum]|nr:hypothetical protein GW17_00014276 [Ensete ventricosum]
MRDLIFDTLTRRLEKVFPGGKNDMTNADLAAKSSHPRTIGPPTARTTDLTQVRSAPPNCKRTPHCKNSKHGGRVRRYGSLEVSFLVEMSPKEESRIFVGGLSWDTTERRLEAEFSRFGKVIEAQV